MKRILKYLYDMSNESNNGVLGFLAGAAVGAALGVLFAPRSGKETREILADKARQRKEDLDELIDKAREEWSKAKGKAMDAATMTREEVSDFIRFLMAEGEDLKERLADDVHQKAEEAAAKAKAAAEKIRHSAN